MPSRICGFCRLCIIGDLTALIKYVELYSITAKDARAGNNYAFRLACEKGHLHVAQWLANYFGLTIEDARTDNNYVFIWACKHGHVCVAQWLIEHFGFTREDIRDRVSREIMDKFDWEPSLEPKSAAKLF